MRIKQLTSNAIFMAILIVATLFIAIPIGQFGYINISDGIILIGMYFLKDKYFALGAGISMMFVDLALGYGQYALASFIIKTLVGLWAYYILAFNKNHYLLLIGLMIVPVGYYFTDVLLYQNLVTPLTGLPLNTLQVIIGFICFKVVVGMSNKKKT